MAKIVFKHVPEEGDRAQIYSHNKLQVGDPVEISHPVGSSPGVVVEACENDPRYTRELKRHGRDPVENMGQGYYVVEVRSCEL